MIPTVLAKQQREDCSMVTVAILVFPFSFQHVLTRDLHLFEAKHYWLSYSSPQSLRWLPPMTQCYAWPTLPKDHSQFLMQTRMSPHIGLVHSGGPLDGAADVGGTLRTVRVHLLKQLGQPICGRHKTIVCLSDSRIMSCQMLALCVAGSPAESIMARRNIGGAVSIRMFIIWDNWSCEDNLKKQFYWWQDHFQIISF